MRSSRVAFAVVVAVGVMPAGASGVNWSAVPSPQPVGGVGSRVYRVRADVKGWNHGHWVLTALPTATKLLGAVSCASARACTAVGEDTGQRNLAERWNGRAWTIQATPPISNAIGLNAVSCAAPNACTALGGYIHAPPRPNTSSYNVTVAERWNGKRWAVQPLPNPARTLILILPGISCVSPNMCMAVGYTEPSEGVGGGGAIAERWNGSSWTMQGVSGAADLSRVSCASVSMCMAVAGDGLMERWNGQTWATEHPPLPGPPADASSISVGFGGLSCLSPTACIAVGNWQDNNGSPSTPPVTLAEQWDGRRWAILATPNPARGRASALNAVSCVSADACIAVGQFQSASGIQLPLAERWDGRKWTIDGPANPPGTGYLSSVSCIASGACMALGTYQTAPTANETPFAERWTATP